MSVLVSKLYVGAVAPESFRLDITSQPTDNIDLSEVTGAVMKVQEPDGNVVTWAADILSDPAPTSSSISIVHVFNEDGSDVTQKGPYVIVGFLTVPTGIVRSEPFRIPAHGQFETECCS